MTEILNGLSALISQSGWLAPLLALAAGILSSFTPCALSTVPLIIGYVGGTSQRDPKRAFLLSLTFAAGAAVTHVDASKGMVTWAKENAELSGLAEAPIRWLVDDCTRFVEREIRRGNRYDAIILDPPSYGRGPKGEIWKIEDNIFDFLNLIRRILVEKPLFVLLNSYTTGLQPAVLSYLLHEALDPLCKGNVDADEVGLRVKSTGLVLPEGAAGRWTPC